MAKHRFIGFGLTSLFLATSSPLQAAKFASKVGGSAWTLVIQANDSTLLQDIHANSYVPWCFDFLKGRGMLKNLAVNVHWPINGAVEVSLARSVVSPNADDATIVNCLDASLKEVLTHHDRPEDTVEFTFIRSRKQ